MSLSPITLGAQHTFLDALNRTVIFHGTNAVTKGPPWFPVYDQFETDISMSENDFAWMQKLGLNVLRLGVMWPGVEPTEGTYDEEYLDNIDNIVKLAASYGVYTLLDMHQDGLSEFFCGEGIPTWAVRHTESFKDKHGYPFPFDSPMEGDDFYEEPKLNNAKIPTKTACSTKKQGPGWHEPTMASADGYQAFWTNVDGMLEKWGDMWAHVAERFSNRPEVLGIELINEPFAGDLYHHPLLMVPRPNPLNADAVNLQPAYDIVASKIREADSDRLIFFDGVTWGDLGAGFTSTPNGDSKSVLGFHYYAPPQLDPTAGHAAFQFKAQKRIAQKLKSGMFLTETSQPDGNNVKFCSKGGIGDAADESLTSWAGWEWKSFCREEEGSDSQVGSWGACKTGYSSNWPGDEPTEAFQESNGRSYAQFVAGDVKAMRYDVDSKEFHLKYEVTAESSFAASTEIYCRPDHYPDGVKVNIEGSAVGVWNEDIRRVVVNVSEGAAVGDVVEVLITNGP
ncbi:hypothetical protein TrVE_jg11694 [Triparma verrucosa]|uniref:Endoglycoceramidase n=2 Tax=Triparma TaxID=722752 RepID=A0A9W6ZP44_9STRA|nr:hypothetical protein TrST_g9057 [Triparma strigata]GMH89078.1 hypothetical protein TrVE_jg11694 [Triparma verrucosa]